MQAEQKMNDRISASQEGTGCEEQLYSRRFSAAEEETRSETWKILGGEFFQQFISPEDTVIDLGAGDGHFIRNISAKTRVAVDLSEHVENLRQDGIEVIVAEATRFTEIWKSPADVVFMSNFLEHLPDKRTLLRVLAECYKALKPGGRLLILQPNIRYIGPAYWDYIDHHIALTEHSLVEAVEVSGFQVEKLIPRFLPYTAKSQIGRIATHNSEWFVRTYLRFPVLWRFFGKQTFLAARKP